MENKQSIQCGSSACWKKYFFVPYLTFVILTFFTKNLFVLFANNRINSCFCISIYSTFYINQCIRGYFNKTITIFIGVFDTSLEWKLSELFCGVGLKKKGEELRMDWGSLPGKTARAKVGIREGSKDPSKKFNFIEKLYPKEDAKPKFTPGGF